MSSTRSKQRVIVVRNTAVAHRSGVPWPSLVFLVLLVVSGYTVLHWEAGMDGLIYPGVAIAGVDVGGHTMAEARQLLEPAAQQAVAREITVTYAGRSWPVTTRQLGLKLDVESRLQAAYALGREDNLLDRLGTQLRLAVLGRSMSLVGDYDTSRLQSFVDRIAVDVFQSAQPAVVSLQHGQASVSTRAEAGRKLDKAATMSMLGNAIAGTSRVILHAPILTIPPPVSNVEAQREVGSLQSILSAKLHLHFAGKQWLLDASSIAPAIALTTVIAPGGAATYQHSLDQRALASYVDKLGAQADQPMQAATVAIRNAHIAVVPAQSGYHLDRNATKQVLAQAILSGGTQDINLPGGVTQPTAPTSAAQTAAQQAGELIRRPVSLTYGTRSWLLGPSQLGDMLRFTPRYDAVAGPVVDVRVDPTLLAKVIAPIETSVGKPPVNAHLVVHAGRVLVSPSLSGLRVAYAGLAAAIQGRGRATQIPLPVEPFQPSMTTAKIEAMGIHDLIVSHTTYFPGSSDARLTNIDAAVKHLDGQLIAPGEVYSFNQRIGDITTAGGYVEGIDIVDNQDVPGIGGGVCQVAVTLFQAAIYAGMPIEERVNHANVVSYYNPIGMDATVFVSASGPDVKFQNNTGHWVLVDFVEDLAKAKLTVRFFGTDPHFKVVVTTPTVTDQPNGDVDAAFTRSVYDQNGNELLNHTFTSHYVPLGAPTTQ
jgi:vancomycin resistance protein YoaR